MQGVMAVRTGEDYVKIPGYYALNIDETGKNIHEYDFEGDFWHAILGYLPGGQHLDGIYKIFPGDRVRLRMFHLSHWVPRVPGLFWKEGSKKLRGAAERELLDASPFFDWFVPKVVFRASSGYWKTETGSMQEVYGLDNFNSLTPRITPIYTPLGKSMQILGGIGNLRLLPSGKDERLLCASSSGTYWQGIPLLVRGDAVNDLSRIIPGSYVDLEGVWVPLPREYAQILGGDTGIQRGCLLVEEKGSIKHRDRNLVSAALTRYEGTSAGWTLFEYRGNDNILRGKS